MPDDVARWNAVIEAYDCVAPSVDDWVEAFRMDPDMFLSLLQAIFRSRP